MRHKNIRTRYQSEILHQNRSRTWITFKNWSGQKPIFERGEDQCITNPSPAMVYNWRNPCYTFHRGRRTKFYVSSA